MVAVSPEPEGVHIALRPVRRSVRIIRTVGRWIRRIVGRIPGEYTIGKLDALDRFRETSTPSWELTILIASPIPCFLTNMLLESIPLTDPALGFKSSLHFQIRHYLTGFVVSLMPVLAKFDFIPQLSTRSWKFAIVYSSILGGVAIGSNAVISRAANVFPVPFAQFAPAVPLAIIGGLLNRQCMKKSSVMKRAEKIDQWIAVDVVPIFVYPLFTALFMAVKPKQQPWLSLLLPIIKRLLRRVIWLVLKDELDIVGATMCTVSHLYHVLFTAMCLQNAKSLDTLGAIVLVNLIQMLLNCLDIMKDADRIQRTKAQLRESSIFANGELVSVALRLARLNGIPRFLHRKSPSRMFSRYPNYQRVNLMVRYHKLLNAKEMAPQNVPSSTTNQNIRLARNNSHRDKHWSLLSAKSLSKQTTPPIEQSFAQILSQPDESVHILKSTTRERTGKQIRAQSVPSFLPKGDYTRQIDAHIHNVTSALHQTEMILLRSYITVFVLLFYGIYLALVFWLPNKKYYATMISTETFSDVDSTVFHLILLGGMEVVFMVMYLILISRRLGVSGIQQLAFILWSQRVLIQAKFLSLSLMIIGFPLEHYGNDVVGFLYVMDDPALSGTELVRSLDTEESQQPLDVASLDDLLSLKNKKIPQESFSSSSCSGKEDVIIDVRSQDAIRRSKYRQKNKDLRDTLQQQVEDLSLQLTTLENKNKKEKRPIHTQVWKALANRHLQARHRAEEQRRRLHQAVEKKTKLIEDLGLLIRKRISEEQPEETFPISKRLRTETPDRALYEAYMKEMDGLYAQTDRIFKETTLERKNEESDEFYSSPEEGDKKSSYHQLVGKSSTPFAFEQVRSHIGRECCMEQVPWCEKIDGPWVPEDTSIVKMRVEVGGESALVQHCILRPYHEAGRVVLVTRKFTEGEGAFAGMHSDETGWSIVRPSPVMGSVGTLLESVIRFVPFNFSRAAASGAAVKHFADVIIRAGENTCQICIKKLDEMLLNEALGVC